MSQTVYPTTTCPQQRRNQNEVKIETSEDSSNTQNDAKALLELDTALRELDPIDPVKYDFALFGLGAIEKF